MPSILSIQMLSATPERSARPTELQGTWTAEAQGRTLTAVFTRQGHAVRGRLDMGPGYCLALAGTGSAVSATGSAEGPLGEARFEAVVSGDQLMLGLTAPNPQLGRDQRMLFRLARAGDDKSFAPCPAAVEQRDLRAVGRWLNKSVHVDGKSVTTDERTLLFGPDGSFTRNEHGARTTGRWRTVAELVYIRLQGADDWQVLASLRPTGVGVRLVLTDGRSFSRIAGS
ncbi:MAG: hypothetical protein ABI794_01665 [Betaproteobacteria bacterium]